MRATDVLGNRFAGSGKSGAIDKTGTKQLRLNRRNASGRVLILHMRFACRSKVAQIRHFFAHLIEEIQIERNAGFVGDGKKMQHAVGAAAERHIARKRVL